MTVQSPTALLKRERAHDLARQIGGRALPSGNGGYYVRKQVPNPPGTYPRYHYINTEEDIARLYPRFARRGA